MATPIILPKQGNTVETCLILEWKKKKGEAVKAGEVICEIETDKAVFELESSEDGILLDIFFEEGEDAPVLTNIAVVGKEGDDYSKFKPRGVSTHLSESEKEDATPEKALLEQVKVEENVDKNDTAKIQHSGEKRGVSPRAKNLANKLAINTAELNGTGPQGRVIERDIWQANKALEPLSLSAKDLISEGGIRPQKGTGIGGRVTSEDVRNAKSIQSKLLTEDKKKIVPLKGIRKLIADRMLSSLQNSAQLTLNSSAEATALLALRKRFKESSAYKDFQEVTLNDLIHYAIIKALSENPEPNSILINGEIEYYSNIHLGFAVDTPRGLMVPVIKNSQNLNLLELSGEAKRLAVACQSGKINTDELANGTITVTNLGNFGIETFTPVLNLPQTAIIGVNTITLKPVKRGNNVDFVPHMAFSLTIDHRVIDGAVGSRFLQSLAKIISEIDMVMVLEEVRR